MRTLAATAVPKTSVPRPASFSNAADIVRHIKHGDTGAETELIRKYQRGLQFFVRHQTNDAELAKEVVQETFLVVLQRLRSKSIQEPEKLSPFLHRTARYIMIGQLRKTARRRTDPNTERIEQTVGSLEDQDASAVRDQEALIVRTILDELTCERDRQILRRFYLLEHDKADICRDLHLGDVHFNRVLYRARQRFGVLVKEFEHRQHSRILESC